MTKYFILFASVITFAANHQVTVAAGDSFNTILRKHHVAASSINAINAQATQLQPLSTLKPNDEIQLAIDESSQKLITASIHTKARNYVLNKENNGYALHLLLPDENVQVISVSSHETTHNSNKLRIQRLSHMLFPEHTGAIQAALEGDEIISIKLLTSNDTKYAFLHKSKNSFPYYFNIYGKPIKSALDRTPTSYKRISSPFNPKRLHPVSKKIMPHKGVDLAAPINTPVWAAAPGKVIHKSSDTGYGNLLIIEHSHGLKTYYAHLNKFHNNIQPGQHVNAFETIGYVGSTGVSTGHHLHFETRLDGTPNNPLTINLKKRDKKIKEIVVPFYYF